MRGEEAREVLGFAPFHRPTPSQIKAAYIRRVWESHPDRFPAHEKSQAESRFKQIAEAYSCLQAGTRMGRPVTATTVRVVRTGVPRASGRCNSALIKAPFLLLILGTISFGVLNVTRAYRRQNEASLSRNPFLP